MNKFKICICFLAFFMIFIKANAQMLDNSETNRNYPLERILNNDGTINVNSNIHGSFDVKNYKMVYGKNNEPVFVPKENTGTLGDENWSSNFSGPTGTNGYVYAVVKDKFNNVYVGGFFENVGGISAKYIAKWDGNSWSSLGEGTDNYVTALAVDSLGNVYAGGFFNNAGNVPASHIAKWDGNTWSNLGLGVSDIVYCIKLDHNGNLYAGGTFTGAGGITANRIAKWDGNNWSAIGSGVNNIVFAIETDTLGNIYVGGMFANVGGLAGNSYLLKFDGTTWSTLGSGLNHYVYSMAFDNNNNLVVGGMFTTAGGTNVNHIAKWNGTSWSALGSGMNECVNSLKIDSTGNIYVVGNFTQANNETVNHIAKWDGSSWSAVGQGTDKEINVIDCDNSGNLYIGGFFSLAGQIGTSYIAKWNGSEWGSFGYGNSTNYTVNDMAVDSSGNIYLGGWFTTAGNVNANHIVKWDGTNWTTFGQGTNDWVTAITVDKSGNIYIGGWFTKIGNDTVNHIAKWNGTSWSALGSGTNAVVRSLVTDTLGNLYAGGDFTTAGGLTVNYLAKWDGNQWSGIGTGMSDKVKTLLVDKFNNLYAGGDFISANGVYVAHVAKYDGINWSRLFWGLNGSVYDLAADPYGNIIACGDFWDDNASHYVYKIAKWNGSQWLPFGNGCIYEIDAVATDDFGNVYAGGYFPQIGQTPANNIAKWNGSDWVSLGSGADYYVYSLKTYKNSVFCGGYFLKAGNKNSSYFAQYINPVEINITGNSITITNGDITPDSLDNTYFGSANIGVPITKTFKIINEGEYPLVFTNNPGVTVSGYSFELTSDVPEYINIGDSAAFEITFIPDSCGTLYGSVSIANNDDDENPYYFVIAGTGIDNVPPVSPTLADLTGECSVTVLNAPTTIDSCAGIVTGTTTDPLSYNTQGTCIIHWTFDDGNGNTILVNQNVIIDDTTNPVTPTLADILGECSASAIAPITTDNCAGTITGTTTDSLNYNTQGTHIIQWTFDDGNGNSITANQNVIVEDITKPTITCVVNQTYNLLQGQTYYTVVGTELDPTATADNCGIENIENSFNHLSTLAGAFLPDGLTTITWTITDIGDNSDSCSFNVQVNLYSGINISEQLGISIYPNPTSGIFSICGKTQSIENMEITNISGKVIFESNHQLLNPSGILIDLSAQPSGIYFIRVISDKGTFTVKMIKE